jgi:antitoxin ParD1/3/4
MHKLTILLPNARQKFVKAQAAAGGFKSSEDYVAHLVRQAELEKRRAHLEELLLEGLKSPSVEWTKDDWKSMRRELKQTLAQA